jgi:hypothetical protein
MKRTIHNIGSAAFLGAILIASQAALIAQSAVESTTVTKTTTSAGIISEFSPETIVIKTETSPDPVRYTYSKTTTYVDETGAPVSQTVVKSGLPVTVYYTQEGEKMVASKVIVRKTVTVTPPAPVTETKKTTTTKTTTEK